MEYIGISLQEYLIKHSEVDCQFIKDFIAIQQSDVSREHYPFVVDLDIIIKWLKVQRKGEIKQTLLRSYIEGVDYIILLRASPKQKRRGGHNKETILTTVKCFKKLCLKTKSSMSDKIIDYYLSLENLVIEYQKYIISVLIDENKLLKNDLNNDIFPQGGLIYVLDLGNGYYKLGFTQDLKQRKRIYDTGHIHKKPIVFWFESEDARTVEACSKGILVKFAIKKKKEVYLTELKNIIHAVKGCAGVLSNLTCEVCNSNSVKNLNMHFKTHHPELLDTRTLFEANYNQQGSSSEKCLEYKLIRENSHEETYLVTDKFGSFRYIVKKGDSIVDEVNAIYRLGGISEFVNECLPEIYENSDEFLITEYIDGYNGTQLDKIPELNNTTKTKTHNLAWLCLIYQLSYFIAMLEENKIQHNNFRLENIVIERCSHSKKFQLKVLDFSMMTDYKYPELVFSSIVSKAPEKEMLERGWNTKFHPGSDLNQIMGEILERYSNIMPKMFIKIIEPLIKKQDKQFPYAIRSSNKRTTGDEIMMLFWRLWIKVNNIKI